jgi:hypothetical protein
MSTLLQAQIESSRLLTGTSTGADRRRRPQSGKGPSLRAPILVATLVGVAAAAAYFAWDLTLSHYDAKAHLVVARRVLDSQRPGWMQIGAVWLPLPHLLNMLPVQIDSLYRTGLSAVAISVGAFVLGVTSAWWMVARATGSVAAAWATFAVLTAQPDVLYLQATPMTEPLLIGLSLCGVAQVWAWTEARAVGRTWPAGLTLALACLTRYEAWPIAAAAISLAAVALMRMGLPLSFVCRRVATMAVLPAVAIVGFFFLSRATVGHWFVTGGFFVADPRSFHRPLVAIGQVLYGVRLVNGTGVFVLALVASAAGLWHVLQTRQHVSALVLVSLGACLLLPLYAFWQGHPFRIRYLVPATMVLAIMLGLGIGFLPRWRRLAASIVIAMALIETPPVSGQAPMVLEAQWDSPRRQERRHVTAYLASHYDGAPILASMGSLAHYMQETSGIGLSISDYIHEGIGDLWKECLESAERHAGWVLIEEQSEGGDVLARLRGQSGRFLDGFARVSEGGGVALYRRTRGALQMGGS